MSSKRKPNSIESDRGKEFYNTILQKFLQNKNIKQYSRKTYLGAVFAERFNRSIGDLLKRPVFEKSDGKWIDILPAITKQYKKRLHYSTKFTPPQASLKKNERFVHNILLDNRNKINQKFQINDLVRTADLKKTLS